jgi:hypothetical protein
MISAMQVVVVPGAVRATGSQSWKKIWLHESAFSGCR